MVGLQETKRTLKAFHCVQLLYESFSLSRSWGPKEYVALAYIATSNVATERAGA